MLFTSRISKLEYNWTDFTDRYRRWRRRFVYAVRDMYEMCRFDHPTEEDYLMMVQLPWGPRPRYVRPRYVRPRRRGQRRPIIDVELKEEELKEEERIRSTLFIIPRPQLKPISRRIRPKIIPKPLTIRATRTPRQESRGCHSRS